MTYGVRSNRDLAILRKSNSWSSAQSNRRDIRHRETEDIIRIIPYEWKKSNTLSWLQQLEEKKVRKVTDNIRRVFEALLINAAACRGNPLGSNTPTSVVVPPTSTTITLFSERSCFTISIPARYDAPRMEFVAPDEKVLMGSRAASAAVIKVPSF